jgi:hypothetical protein
MKDSYFLPEWLRKKYLEGKNHPHTRQKLEVITDFPWLIEKVWCISNKDYQEAIWLRNEDPHTVDSYDDTIMYFGEDSKAVLEARSEGSITMSELQYTMLKQLFNMVEKYDASLSRPDTDAEIIEDPKWHEIREYAKVVYQELTKE